jgi:dipeptidyl aminopeptidase/acylaminoacyl peptidase
MPESHPMTFDDLIAVPRISDPALSPHGRHLAYVRSVHDPVNNRVHRTIMVADLETETERDLTPGEHDASSPAWSPDGTSLAFVSARERGEQLWLLPFAAGGEARRLTTGPGGIRRPVWAPDGRRIAFSRSLSEPEAEEPGPSRADGEPEHAPAAAELRARAFGLQNPKSSARLADGLLFRHWNAWRDGRTSRVFILDVVSGAARQVTPAALDVPPVSLGGTQDFVFSPDGRELCYVANPDRVVATSTNNSIFVQPLDGIEAVGEPHCLSDTEAMDREPRYSPDGTRIAWLGAERPGYESDRMRVKVYDRTGGSLTSYTEDLDRSAAEIAWRDDEEVLFLAPDRGSVSLYGVLTRAGGAGRIRQYTAGVYQRRLIVRSPDELILLREGFLAPPDLVRVTLPSGVAPDLSLGPGSDVRLDGEARRLTPAREALAEVAPHPVESFWYAGADEDPVHGFLMKPPAFDERRSYPFLLLIHGGPQSAFYDQFHVRWNAAVFAGAGFVVGMLNPRGSTGYGQRFTDQISGDWGGRCYEDIMRGVDHMLAHYPFIDGDRLAAAGGSFGGYMIAWIAGHTDRFRALVCHDGIFNQESMSYTTDELWFDIWEHGGLPYEDPERFRRHSPHLHAGSFQTPMLVIQGGVDYRCPVGEGVGLFQALQARGVPSRLLYFEDEGHFVTQPANAEVWYRTVIEFVKHHLG